MCWLRAAALELHTLDQKRWTQAILRGAGHELAANTDEKIGIVDATVFTQSHLVSSLSAAELPKALGLWNL